MALGYRFNDAVQLTLNQLQESVDYCDFVVWRYREKARDFRVIASTKNPHSLDSVGAESIPGRAMQRRSPLIVDLTTDASEIWDIQGERIDVPRGFKRRGWTSVYAKAALVEKESFVIGIFYNTDFDDTEDHGVLDALFLSIRVQIDAALALADMQETHSKISRGLLKISTAEVAIGYLHDIKDILHQMEDPMDTFARLNREGAHDRDLLALRSYVERAKELSSAFIEQVRDHRIRMAPVRIHSLLEPVLSKARVEARGKSCLFKTPSSRRHNPLVEVDTHRIVAVISNILSNAFYFAGPGFFGSPSDHIPTVEVTVRPATANRVRIEVRDNGVGVEDTERVFELGYSTRPGGSGLGLAIAKRVIREHNGTIEVTSKPGKGSSLVLHLPVSTWAGT